ncbi:fasciclin domain-containing protein [Paenibacillus gansuensis]|uniref:Fasciclin domain-containing protein n=1 Tax=Paenibacillus gansuensis TaxID=306542 RepID=A0ABW5PAQ9_9BACL
MAKVKWFAMVLALVMLVVPMSSVMAAEGDKDIVDTAVGAGTFNTLVAAVTKAGLAETLKGEGPYTVFAPTDEAFAALLKQLNVTADELLARKDLKDILLYHVVQGKVLSTDLKDGMEATTVNGKKVKISLDPVMANDSKVVTADIQASNGVIHVIDAVLLPPADEAAPVNPETGDSSTILYAYLAGFSALVLGIYAVARRKRGFQQ